MMLPISLSVITEFKYYNYVFDGIIALFTLIYFFVGFKRGILRSLWAFVFDLVSLAAVFCIYKFVCPLFVDKIPVVLVNLIPSTGIAFALTTMYTFIIEIIISVIAFLIIRCGIFRAILRRIKEHDYTYQKKKNFFGRITAAVLTGGLAFLLSSGAIVTTKKMTGYTLLRNYDAEMSETYVAKYADKFVVKLVNYMIRTDSIANPHDTLVGVITEGNYTYSDIPYYRDAAYRLIVTYDVDKYLSVINAKTNAGLVRFSQDLHVWAIMADVHGTEKELDEMVKPIAKKAKEKGYAYTGDVTAIAPFYRYQKAFSAETYSYLVEVLG